jgi:hypothetical protein
MNLNELKTLFLNPKADILIFYGDIPKDSIIAKFMFDWINIAQATYRWSDAATAGNFELALRGKSIDWLNYIKDMKEIDFSLGPGLNNNSNLIMTFKYKLWIMFGTFQIET